MNNIHKLYLFCVTERLLKRSCRTAMGTASKQEAHEEASDVVICGMHDCMARWSLVNASVSGQGRGRVSTQAVGDKAGNLQFAIVCRAGTSLGLFEDMCIVILQCHPASVSFEGASDGSLVPRFLSISSLRSLSHGFSSVCATRNHRIT